MRRWASLRCRRWGGSPFPAPEVPRAPRENNAPEELLKCHSGWDVPVPGLWRARSDGRRRVPEANRGGCARPRGLSALGRAPGPPDSQVVSTGHRRKRRAGAEEPRSGGAGLGAAFPGSDGVAGSSFTAFLSFAQSFPTSCVTLGREFLKTEKLHTRQKERSSRRTLCMTQVAANFPVTP